MFAVARSVVLQRRATEGSSSSNSSSRTRRNTTNRQCLPLQPDCSCRRDITSPSREPQEVATAVPGLDLRRPSRRADHSRVKCRVRGMQRDRTCGVDSNTMKVRPPAVAPARQPTSPHRWGKAPQHRGKIPTIPSCGKFRRAANCWRWTTPYSCRMSP